MKIYADKIESAPPHGLRVSDMKVILAAVPHDWIDGLKEVRLANSMEYYSPYAYFSRYDGGLTVYLRTGTKKEAMAAVLSALVVESLGINRGLKRRRSEAEKQRIAQLVQPFLKTLLPAIIPATKLQSFKFSPEAHTPVQFVPFPNDAT